MPGSDASDSHFLLLAGGQGKPSTQLFSSEDSARAEFRRASRSPRSRVEWMELAVIGDGGRLEQLDRFSRN